MSAPLSRKLALSPEDWFWATWRNLPPLPRPKTPAFDLAAGLERLARVPEAPFYTEGWNWSRARISSGLGEEEARFWLTAMLGTGRELSPEKMARSWKKAKHADHALEALPGLLLKRETALPEEFWLPLLRLYPLSDVFQQFARAEREMASDASFRRNWTSLANSISLARGFRAHGLPYLTPEEKSELAEAVRGQLDLNAWPSDAYEPVPLALSLAAALGFHNEMRSLVATWKPSEEPHRLTRDLLFGLGSAELVIAERERLKLSLERELHIRAWFAHTEFSALEPLRDTILAEKRKGEATPLIAALGLARGPETAAVMLELLARSRAPDAARAWLERYPECSVAVMVEAARGRGKVADGALSVLQTLVRKGHEEAVRAAVGSQPDRLSEALFGERVSGSAGVMPGWLTAAAAGLREKDAPSWLGARELPPLTTAGETIPDEGVALLLAALSRSTLAEPHPLVAAVRAHADAHALDAFAWRLYELWHQHGMKQKESWALAATGLLGSDGCALKLGPLAKTLREGARHRPAGLALECLKHLGTDTALMQLRAFTRIPRDWSLKETAQGYLEEIAAARGVSMEQLEDRMVPDCGLDPRGRRTFDFGPRQFEFALGPGLKPMVRESSGKLRPDLPKPGAKDDPALGPAAAAAWSVLKKQWAEVCKLQVGRLERAMVNGRRWSRAEWEDVLVRHPVMTHLAQGLVWGVFSTSGALEQTFRVAEDMTYAGPDDEPSELPVEALVGLPHPLQLSAELLGTWGERWSDYELTPPFPQLDRPVYRPEPDEAGKPELTRFAGIPCMAIALVDGLERRGWTRDSGSGYISEFRRDFPAAGVTALLENEPGAAIWDIRNSDDQTIPRVTFHRHVSGDLDRSPGNRIPLDQVDPVAFSEVVADLSALTRR